MDCYYSQRLSAERLKLCYDLAPPSVQRYLNGEIEHVRERVGEVRRMLELGCGFGRALRHLTSGAGTCVGIDTSLDSLRLAKSYLAEVPNVVLVGTDAILPAFRERTFDAVFCIQNGVSAFHVNRRALFECAVRLTRPGGRILFSSYAEEFWEERLAWFRIQASHGLVGEIDTAATRNGVIVCRDGFTASTVGADEFRALSKGLGTGARIETIGGSSVFCEITA